MADKYTQEDKEAFIRKDKMNSRMSALKAVASLYEGTQKTFADLKSEAESWYSWVYSGKLPLDIESTTLKNDMGTPVLLIPEPTAKQLEILEEIAAKSGLSVETVKKSIVNNKDWHKDGKPQYPNVKKSIPKVIEYLRSL